MTLQICMHGKYAIMELMSSLFQTTLLLFSFTVFQHTRFYKSVFPVSTNTVQQNRYFLFTDIQQRRFYTSFVLFQKRVQFLFTFRTLGVSKVSYS